VIEAPETYSTKGEESYEQTYDFKPFETPLLPGRTPHPTDFQTSSASMHPSFGSPPYQSSVTDEQRRTLQWDDFPGELPGRGSPRISLDVFSTCLNTFLVPYFGSNIEPYTSGPRDLIPDSRMLVFISSEP
jgi:hypothetical protein